MLTAQILIRLWLRSGHSSHSSLNDADLVSEASNTATSCPRYAHLEGRGGDSEQSYDHHSQRE